MIKRQYSTPEIIKITLDNTISIRMLSGPPVDPPPRAVGKGKNEPFQSPFGDKPFG